MIFLPILILELIALYIFSLLFTRSFGRLVQIFSSSRKLLVFLYTILFLPGTLIHELAHFLMAAMLRVPVGHIQIFPEVVGNDIHLGTVSTAETDIFRRTLIGVAPFIIGTLLIIVSLFYLPNFFIFWQKAVVVYLIFEISNTMFSSSEDLKESWGLFVAIFVLTILALFTLYYFKISLTFTIDFYPLVKIFLFPLGVNVMAFLIAKFCVTIGINGRKATRK